MLIQGLYGVVDSIFISALGEKALTAISLVAIPQTFISSAAAGLSVGTNAALSASLGRNDQTHSRKVTQHSLILQGVCMLVTVCLGIWAVTPFLSLFTKDSEVLTDGGDYLRIIMLLSIFMYTQVTFERLLQSSGKNRMSMLTQAVGTIVNMILDPILIFGIGGFLQYGMRGAAYATVIGQAVASFTGLVLNLKYNPEVQLTLKHFAPEGRVFSEILSTGLPAIVMATVGSVMNFFINRVLIPFSESAIAVYGVYSRLQRFILIPTFGLGGAIVTLVAYNYGAGNRERIRGIMRWSFLYHLIGFGIDTAVFVFFPKQLMKPFHPTQEMLDICLPIFYIIGITFLFTTINAPLSSFFQAVGKGQYSLIIVFCRQLVVRVPLAYYLASFGNLSLVWWCWPVSEIVSDILSLIYYHKVLYTDPVLSSQE